MVLPIKWSLEGIYIEEQKELATTPTLAVKQLSSLLSKINTKKTAVFLDIIKRGTLFEKKPSSRLNDSNKKEI